MEIILKHSDSDPLRLAFPAIYEPRAMANDPTSKPAYGSKFPIKPGGANHKLLEATLAKVAEEKWPGKGATILAKLKSEGRVCFVESTYNDKDGEPREGFEDMFYLSTRSEKLKPTVKDRFNKSVAEGEQGAPYAGCYVHAAVDIYAQDHPSFGRRINCILQGVMFAADGPSFSGGRPASDSTFSGLAAEPSAEDFV
jgi:hypothetical protein